MEQVIGFKVSILARRLRTMEKGEGAGEAWEFLIHHLLIITQTKNRIVFKVLDI